MALSPKWRHRFWAVLIVLALAAIPPLWAVVHWLAVAGVGAAVVLGAATKWSEFVRALIQVLGALVMPWLCLFGFNWLFDGVVRTLLDWDPPRLGLVPSLFFAGVIFWFAAWGYLVAWREGKWAAPLVALVLAAVNVIGVPLLIAAPQHESKVAAPGPVDSQLDVTIVVPASGDRVTPIAPVPSVPAGWDVRYSVARARGTAVEWLLVDSRDPAAANAAARGGAPLPAGPRPRSGVDQAVLLDVDAAGAGGRADAFGYWLEVAKRAVPPAAVGVLLRGADDARRTAWERRVEPGGSVATAGSLGTVTLADAAFALAVAAPDTSEELALAYRFRPILLFDEGETLDQPLEIDDYLASGRIQLCHENSVRQARGECDPVRRSADLVNGKTHLHIEPPPAGASRVHTATAIYVHPTRVRRGVRTLVYLDYWWFLDGNPAGAAAGITCGVGLAMPGRTCFDHPSDWEGITVVVDAGVADPNPIAVQYAQHNDVVRYDFDELSAFWKAKLKAPPANGGWGARRLRRNLDLLDDLDQRPLAFVARGTHATYPEVCPPPGHCNQTVASGTPENPHTGFKSWSGNVSKNCFDTNCVRIVPTRHAGRDAALWNAYEGLWGDRECILNGAYCTSEEAPAAPATQRRYKHPTRVTAWAHPGGKPHPCVEGSDPPCSS